MEFKAELKDGLLVVNPIIVRKGNDVEVHVPALSTITKLIREQNGIGNI